MMSRVLLALALLGGAIAQLPDCSDSSESDWEYDAGSNGIQGCKHVKLFPDGRCGATKKSERTGVWLKDYGVSPATSAEACPKTCDKVLKKAKKKGSVCKPWKSKTCPGGKWIRSNSNTDGEVKLGKVKSPAECVEMVQSSKKCSGATIAQVDIPEIAAFGNFGKAICWCQFGGEPTEQLDQSWASCYLGEGGGGGKKCSGDDKKWKDKNDGMKCKKIKKMSSKARKEACKDKKLKGLNKAGDLVTAKKACCKTCKKY
jgi:hypothetical protein